MLDRTFMTPLTELRYMSKYEAEKAWFKENQPRSAWLRLSGSPTQLRIEATHGESAPSDCCASGIT
jgi:hypothetical protein